MSQTNMQKAYQLLIFVMLIGFSMSRPNGSIDNQQGARAGDNQLNIADMEKAFPYYRSMQPLQYFTYEPNPLDRLTTQYRSYAPNDAMFRPDDGGLDSIPNWLTVRQLVQKRQTRFRQCYFNPISCFK